MYGGGPQSDPLPAGRQAVGPLLTQAALLAPPTAPVLRQGLSLLTRQLGDPAPGVVKRALMATGVLVRAALALLAAQVRRSVASSRWGQWGW